MTNIAKLRKTGLPKFGSVVLFYSLANQRLNVTVATMDQGKTVKQGTDCYTGLCLSTPVLRCMPAVVSRLGMGPGFYSTPPNKDQLGDYLNYSKICEICRDNCKSSEYLFQLN